MMSAPASSEGRPPAHRMHLPSLLVALTIMTVGSIYPLLFADARGQADHSLAMALFWAMSAGLVRGVGFVPLRRVWRWLFSGWACAAALVLAAVLRWGV
jgi:predicted membrane protein